MGYRGGEGGVVGGGEGGDGEEGLNDEDRGGGDVEEGWDCGGCVERASEEFETTWKRMIDDYDLDGYKWLNGMYNLRSRWAASFSNNKFTATSAGAPLPDFAPFLRRKLSDEQALHMIQPIDNEEIRAVLFRLQKDKAPGHEGTRNMLRESFDSVAEKTIAWLENLRINYPSACNDLVSSEGDGFTSTFDRHFQPLHLSAIFSL
ncbi:hypothetical protein BUALT_Bualt13G0073100 [Buddleja alternifolia]|uniref:Protein FAR1-RELATED SEQUENCE n=1 Tax=Buddleja alternifolia TaxID=168488 RepID=A0AAV6WUJ9_9LAMI|nr:hypothetical protein BUALT_Bualt13G0073100 [Buddleja alternifolia]